MDAKTTKTMTVKLIESHTHRGEVLWHETSTAGEEAVVYFRSMDAAIASAVSLGYTRKNSNTWVKRSEG
jgi:hypothetical protein